MKDQTDNYLIAQAIIIALAAILGAIAIVRHARLMDETTALLERTSRYVAAEKGVAL